MNGSSSTHHPTARDADFYRRESEESHRTNDFSPSRHIRLASPESPDLRPNPRRNQSSRSMTEALRLARSAEEQETLLGEEEVADDDGNYPPRKNDDPRAPNPHANLPVYTTIHRIRRLVIASIGMVANYRPCDERD